MSDANRSFHTLMTTMTQAICRGDGAAAAACFTPEGVYHDGFYGEFRGREAIRNMVVEHFHGHASDFTWSLSDALSDGRLGYLRYAFTYQAKIAGSEGKRVHFSGIAQVRLEDGLIARYSEIFDRGVALVQMDFAAERIAKSLKRWAAEEAAKPA